MSVCRQSLAVQIPAHAQIQWCAAVTEDFALYPRASPRTPQSCESLSPSSLIGFVTPVILSSLFYQLSIYFLNVLTHRVPHRYRALLATMSCLKHCNFPLSPEALPQSQVQTMSSPARAVLLAIFETVRKCWFRRQRHFSSTLLTSSQRAK